MSDNARNNRLSHSDRAMQLEIITPTAVLVDCAAIKIIAEGPHGHFALLPRHADMAIALAPGLLFFVSPEGHERYLGVDEGVLVKRDHDVHVSVLDAFESENLTRLREEVANRFRSLDEHERIARTAVARLEAGAIRHMLEIER
jgi:F-type H+-transporting ATPase subunit epsilon